MLQTASCGIRADELQQTSICDTGSRMKDTFFSTGHPRLDMVLVRAVEKKSRREGVDELRV